MPALSTDFYTPAAARTPGSAAAPMVSLSGSVSQSASGSATAQGAPAVWFLLLVATALVLLHAD